jgi:large subunit ribosomal protein L23
MELKEVIKRPLITEKTTALTGSGRYSFEVARQANKKEIARAVEEIFGVHVVKVWTVTKPKKKKKAIVQLKKEEKIDLFETGE